jgi:serine/threonine-protein kinase ATR
VLCDKTDCLNQTTDIDSLALAPYLPLISELFKGSEEQVTSHVRRRVYLALCAIYKHHRGTEQLNSFVELTFRGLDDIDRSVRVIAGCVFYGNMKFIYT